MSSSLSEQIAEALVGDVDPERLEAFRFAAGILPVFPLIRSLFSQNEVDTCLKLMLLHELSRAQGRSTLERIRALAGFLDPGRVDGLVRSLRDGGWLELRASDNTYAPALAAMSLLSLLHGADVGNVTPQNALARAAQSAEFAATLDGSRTGVGYLLDMLHVLVEGQVDEARQVLTTGRAFRMIGWSRREHARQLETIRAVLDELQDRLDAASREFARVVRLHQTLQELVRMHTSIHVRLREWNLERLYTSDRGYSMPQLAEAVLGCDEGRLTSLLDDGLVQAPVLAPSLTVDEIRARFHGARRKLPSQQEPWTYSPPDEPEAQAWRPADTEPSALLRARLTELLRERTAADPPLELEEWVEDGWFAEVAWQLAVAARLEHRGPTFPLDDGRRCRVSLTLAAPSTATPGALLAFLERQGALRSLPAGLFTRLTLGICDDDG